MTALAEVRARAESILAEVEKAIVGKRGPLELILLALLSDGHVLLEDFPGLAKTGPGRKANSVVRWSKICEPVTSPGMRSGVNWMRAKPSSATCANERAISVFASPG